MLLTSIGPRPFISRLIPVGEEFHNQFCWVSFLCNIHKMKRHIHSGDEAQFGHLQFGDLATGDHPRLSPNIIPAHGGLLMIKLGISFDLWPLAGFSAL